MSSRLTASDIHSKATNKYTDTRLSLPVYGCFHTLQIANSVTNTVPVKKLAPLVMEWLPSGGLCWVKTAVVIQVVIVLTEELFTGVWICIHIQ